MAASIQKHPKSDLQPSKDAQKPPSNKRKGKESVSKSSQKPVEPEPWSAQSTDDDIPWNWASLTDPSSSRVPPVFTKDGSYFFSLVGSSVKIYSTTTGQIVSTLTAPTDADGDVKSNVLTSAAINPQNAFQLLTTSLDGRVMIWDFVNATLLQTIRTGQPIHFMCVHEKFKGSIFVAAARPRKKAGTGGDNNAVVLQISLKHSEHTSQPVEIMPVGKTRFPTGLAISPNGKWLVATAGHKVYVAMTSSLESGFTKYVSPERLRCLAFHPFEEYFATGDDKGVVRLWYCLNNDLAINVRGVEKRTQTRTLHWHAHAVSSISFTPNGAYLLSGGEEAVLVIWQLHSGKKEFVPRLGAQISTVSVSKASTIEEEYLVGLADATYVFVSSSTLKIARSYSRIKIDPTLSQEYPSTSKLATTPIAVQPLTSTLVLPSSHPSSLQIYSPSTSTLIGELEVSPSNRVSRRDEKPLIPSVVETVIISASGTWMATVDAREADAGFRSEVYLKFWTWDRNQNNWVLNTRIDRPHGTDKVTDISFSPSMDEKSLHLVTTGRDGRIKVWKLWSNKKSTESEAVDTWASFATLTYRSEIPTSVSWSPDASLFAVSVGAHVVLYDTLSTSHRQTLTSPSCQKIQSVHFIGADGRRLLASGDKSLMLWDLIDMQVSWEREMQTSIYKIVPHPREPSFAVFRAPDVTDEEYKTKVSIFSALSSVSTSTRSVPFGLRNVVWNSANKRSGFNLVGVTHSWRVIMMGDSQPTFKNEGLSAKGLSIDHQPQKKTLFQDIFGVSAFADTSLDFTPTPSLQRNDNKIPEVFSTPAYLAPSLDFLFDPLLKSFLVTRPEEPSIAEDEVEEDIDEDIVMEDEANVTRSTSAGQSSRVLVPGEMDALVKLFKTSCMTETHAAPKTHSKVNGIHPKEVNGVHRPVETPLSKSKRLPDSGPRPVIPPASPSPSVGGIGKKRKKTSS